MCQKRQIQKKTNRFREKQTDKKLFLISFFYLTFLHSLYSFFLFQNLNSTFLSFPLALLASYKRRSMLSHFLQPCRRWTHFSDACKKTFKGIFFKNRYLFFPLKYTYLYKSLLLRIFLTPYPIKAHRVWNFKQGNFEYIFI